MDIFFYNSRTAFHLACFKVDSEIINHLYSLGVNINVQDADEATPMHKVEIIMTTFTRRIPYYSTVIFKKQSDLA